jgi:hypothetical protein
MPSFHIYSPSKIESDFIKIRSPMNSTIIQKRTQIIENGIPKTNGSTLLAIAKTGKVNIANIKIVNTTKLN